MATRLLPRRNFFERAEGPRGQRERGARGIFRTHAGAGRQRARPESDAGINFRPGFVKSVIPRQDIFQEKPGAHRIAEFKPGRRQDQLQVVQRASCLLRPRKGLVYWRQSADKTLPRAAIHEHRTHDATAEGNPLYFASETVSLNAGNRPAIAGGPFDHITGQSTRPNSFRSAAITAGWAETWPKTSKCNGLAACSRN